MYQKAYGILETLSPLHVGATAGEESGNLNLIFRDQFTQTGIIPGSSLRGRFRAEMRFRDGQDENEWYGNEAKSGVPDSTTESRVKFEYASIVWLPVFCPGQPVVWVSCPRLLQRYQRIAEISEELPEVYTASHALHAPQIDGQYKLFFNFGFLKIGDKTNLKAWFPDGKERPAVIVADDEIGMIHDMALYRQSRVKLSNDEKKVDGGAFFNTEALPENTILVFPVAVRKQEDLRNWSPFGENTTDKDEMYFGGLESIGFGHCLVMLHR
ncbi:MAG: type III-B CRISPR module RAMP protein Cmr4 [Cyanobacteria bacterium SID2]|nr:type III-B CRISPR module RAMP protein Cmr4 [Cyanobacteria bacterium SID2]MBP0003125.1 type III-B CRISPR module RAMP protein Cmr4 [Cyanobacteria bacterium SBC]